MSARASSSTSAFTVQVERLNSLLAISILFVVLRHLEVTHIISANLGVTIFFFISGYIITRLMSAEQIETGRFAIKAFYRRRIVRLVPALMVMLAGVVGLAAVLGHKIDWGQVAAGTFYYMNYYSIMLRDAGQEYTLPINPLWSLAVEEHFYMFFPFMFVACIGSPARFIRILLWTSLAILVWRLINIFVLGFTPKYNYFASESRMDTILGGSLLALVSWRASEGKANALRLIVWLSHPWVLLAGTILLLASLFIPGEELANSIRYSAQTALLFAIMCGVLYSTKLNWLRGLLSLSPMTFLGRISYSLYLWHLPVAFFLPDVVDENHWFFKWLALGLSILVATVSHYLLERPLMRRFSHGPSSQTTVA